MNKIWEHGSLFQVSFSCRCRDFLVDEIATILKDVLEKFIEHMIDGKVFLSLDDDLLREIAPLVSDRFKIKWLLTTLLYKNILTVSFYC